MDADNDFDKGKAESTLDEQRKKVVSQPTKPLHSLARVVLTVHT
jgi:hypothetical protein